LPGKAFKSYGNTFLSSKSNASVQADLPQNFLTDNSTCWSFKLILKQSALSPPYPTLRVLYIGATSWKPVSTWLPASSGLSWEEVRGPSRKLYS